MKNLKKVSHISIGKIGEQLAAKYLIDSGLTVVGRNWRCKQGELDLICWDGDTLVFVEVKSRVDSAYARKHIFDNVDERKQKKLRQLVEIFMHRMFLKTPKHRLDLIGVFIDSQTLGNVEKAKASKLRHIVSAI